MHDEGLDVLLKNIMKVSGNIRCVCHPVFQLLSPLFFTPFAICKALHTAPTVAGAEFIMREGGKLRRVGQRWGCCGGWVSNASVEVICQKSN